jgi:dipeptidyl aminopeptidase/acylaminoacyl peptidase
MHWTVLAGIAAVLLIGAAAYGAAGLVGLHIATDEAGGCHPEHAAFTPANFSTSVWVSDAFDASALDPTPYLMPDYEEVVFQARDEPAITIHGWWVPGPTVDAPAIIVVHGQGSCRRDPAILVPAGMLHRQGLGVLLIDMRDNGDSTREDGRYGFGSDEYRDVLGAWDWLRAQSVPSERIGLFGQSGGAPAVVVAMGEQDSLAAAWVDSGPSDLATVAAEEADRIGFPRILIPPAIFWMRLFGDEVVDRSPLAEAARIGTRPLQIVHGTRDSRVAPHHAADLEKALEAANPANRVWLIEGAEHVEGPFLVPAEYERRVGEFFHAALAA